MRAVITDVDNFSRRARLLTADGRTLSFGVGEWQGSARPLPGGAVEIRMDGDRLAAVLAGDGAGLFVGGWPKTEAYLPESEAGSRFSWVLFSLDGRLGRLPYGAAFGLGVLLAVLALPQMTRLHALADELSGRSERSVMESLACALGYFCYYGGWFVLLWLMMAPGVKRLHDAGRTGLLMLVPVVMLWLAWIGDALAGPFLPWPLLPAGLAAAFVFGVGLCLWPSTPGENRFGAPPE